MVEPVLACPSDNELRRRTSIKWSRTKRGDITPDIAELDFDVALPIQRMLHSAVARSDFGYPDFTSGTPVGLREVFVERMSCVTIPVDDLEDITHLRETLSAQSAEGAVPMLVLCQPHNPTGHVFTERTLNRFHPGLDVLVGKGCGSRTW